jgi:plasmid stabilization system protein ParE
MKLAWRARALTDLEAIISYIAERSEPAAERLQPQSKPAPAD